MSPLCTGVSTIDCIVHAIVFFDKRTDTWIILQPRFGTIVRLCVLNYMLGLNVLISNRGNTKL